MKTTQEVSKLLWRYVRWLAAHPPPAPHATPVQPCHAAAATRQSGHKHATHQLVQERHWLSACLKPSFDSASRHASSTSQNHLLHSASLPIAVQGKHSFIRPFSSSSSSLSEVEQSKAGAPQRDDTGEGRQELARIIPRLAMVFTCTKCDTRSVKTFSKRSYEKGLVMVRCPGCNKHHLVADHLGWFGDKGWTIERLAEETGARVKVMTPGASAAGQQVEEQLAVEDWVGWSKVEQLLSKANQQQAQDEQQQGQGGSSRAADAVAQGAPPDAPPDAQAAAQAQEQEGVWEVAPTDVEHWMKVKQHK